MPADRGRTTRVSLPRRWIVDCMHFAKRVPSIPVERRMQLAPVAAAREALSNRPSWVALFTKAFAVVAREVPELRRMYMGTVRPRIYEHPTSVASIAVEREYQGEPAVFFGKVQRPDEHSLIDLTETLRRLKSDDLWSVGSYRQLIRTAKLPLPLRRLAWWYGLSYDGPRRAKRLGTFGVSVYSGLGAESLHPISPLTTLLTYGVIDANGAVGVRLIYDHRVMDGSTVARSLARIEEVLRTTIVAELRGEPQSRAA